MKCKQGFTLIELLVVIAIIALLLAVIVPSLRKAKAIAQRLVCSNNQHQLGVALIAYADEYDSKFPAVPNVSSGDWLHDVPCIAAHQIMNFASLDVMFCPTNRQGKDYTERFFCVYLTYVNSADYPDPEKAFGGWGMTDYLWFFTWGHRPLSITSAAPPYYGSEMFVAKSTEKRAAQKILVSDIVWTHDGVDFSHVVDPFPRYPDTGEQILRFPSNHLDSGKPKGSNQLYMDGHTEWKSFDEMHNHYTAPSRNVQHWW